MISSSATSPAPRRVVGVLSLGHRGVRVFGVVAAVLVLVLVLGALWWFLFVPAQRPLLRADNEVHAIDVSGHQGEIEWRKVSADGIEAAMIKATEGADYVDQRFAVNWTDAAKNGVRRGAYHFFTLCSSGRDQAENFLKTAPPDSDALAPAVDLELLGGCELRPSREVVVHELDDFKDAVEEAWGRELLVYARSSFTDEYSIGELGNNDRWVTNFFVRPVDDDWTMWQVHYFARVDGIDGDVDLDVLRGPAHSANRTQPFK